MAFAKTFNPAVPVGVDLVSDVDTFITDFKVGLNERVALEHYNLTTSAPNAGSDTDSAATAQGRHIPGLCGVVYVGTTAQIAALTGMRTGCLAYDTDLSQLKVYGGGNWTTYVSAGKIAFSVQQSGVSMVATTPTKMVFTSEDFDFGGGITPSVGTYTIPVTGLYQFNLYTSAASTTKKTQVNLKKNGTAVAGSYAMAYTNEGSNASMANGSCLISCTAGDTIEMFWLHEDGGTKTVTATFSGYRVA